MALKLHHAVLGGLVLAAVIWAFGRDADDAPRNRDLRQENGTTETRFCLIRACRMRLSQFHLHTTKETPADADIVSHQLMLRAGMIRKLAAGLYTWTPLGCACCARSRTWCARK
jgi:hypothetical protein